MSAPRKPVLQAGATLLPSLSSSYSYKHAQSPTVLRLPLPPASGAAEPGLNVPLSATDTNTVSAILQYVVYDGGASHASVGIAAASYSAAQSELSAVAGTVERDVTSAYFNLVQAQRAIRRRR
jgi:outer membrane protein TolC